MREATKKYLPILTRPEVVFGLLVSIFGVLSAFLVPQLSVSDENMHFLRAYNLATADLGEKACSYPTEVNQKAASVYEGYYEADYKKTVDFSQTTEATCGSAAAYPPILHAPQALGIFLAKLTHPSTGLMVLFGRLFNLAFYTAALYFIIKHVKVGKWVFVVIGLFPLMVHMAASLSADTVNNVAVLAFAALLFNLFTQKTKISRKQSLLLLAVVGTLALTKLANIVLLLPLAFLPVRLFEKNTVKKLPFNSHKWMLGLTSIILVILLILAWQRIYGAPLVAEGPENPLASNPLHFLTILSATYINPFIGYTDVVFRGLIGEFASFRYHLPMFLVVVNFFLLFFVLLRKDEAEVRFHSKSLLWLSASSLGAIVLFIASVSYAMYTAWAIQPFRLGPGALYADGVQGRYFTAAVIFLVPLFIWLRRFYWVQVKDEKTLSLAIYMISGGSLLFYTIETYRFFA